MNQWVTQLPKVVSVWQEDIDLPEPLGQFAARFSHLPGTVMLLSGGNLDASQYHILGILPWLSIKAFGNKIAGKHLDPEYRPLCLPADRAGSLSSERCRKPGTLGSRPYGIFCL